MIYHQDENATIYNGDCIEVMALLPENSVDAVVTDPPYGLEFMGKEWDITDQQFHQQWAEQALRLLKPGGFMLAFGGTRTSHRLVCGIEDAGFEIRDTVMWLYGSGFPKSLDVSKQIDKMAGAEREVVGEMIAPDGQAYSKRQPKQWTPQFKDYAQQNAPPPMITKPSTPEAQHWQGWGTALKPAFEPICVARKPLLEKNVASNVLKWGTGGIDIDGSRVGVDRNNERQYDKENASGNTQSKEVNSFGFIGIRKDEWLNKGRWPANVILECTCDEPHTDPDCPCYMLDEQSGERAGAHGGGKGYNWFGGEKQGQAPTKPIISTTCTAMSTFVIPTLSIEHIAGAVGVCVLVTFTGTL